MTSSTTISISCGDCSRRHTDACEDCVVSFVLAREPDDAVIIDAAEARALRLLAGHGLVPELRYSGRATG